MTYFPMLSHADDFLTHLYDISNGTISYGWLPYSSVWYKLSCYLMQATYCLIRVTYVPLVSHMDIVSYYPYDMITNVIVYGRLTISSVWYKVQCYLTCTDDLVTHPYGITTVIIFYGWLSKSSVWQNTYVIRLTNSYDTGILLLSHMDDLVTRPYDIAILLSSHADDLLIHPHDVTIVPHTNFITVTLHGCHYFSNKQRVLMHRHQGWNVRHGLCHIYMRYLYIYELFIAFVCFVVCSLL